MARTVLLCPLHYQPHRLKGQVFDNMERNGENKHSKVKEDKMQSICVIGKRNNSLYLLGIFAKRSTLSSQAEYNHLKGNIRKDIFARSVEK